MENLVSELKQIEQLKEKNKKELEVIQEQENNLDDIIYPIALAYAYENDLLVDECEAVEEDCVRWSYSEDGNGIFVMLNYLHYDEHTDVPASFDIPYDYIEVNKDKDFSWAPKKNRQNILDDPYLEDFH